MRRTREPYQRDHHADEAAVKRHAAVPDPEQPGRIGHELFEAVEEDVADAAAEHRAQRAVEHDVGNLLRGPVGVHGARASVAEPPRHHERREIGEAVPTDRDRSVADDHRVDVGIVQKPLRVFER